MNVLSCFDGLGGGRIALERAGIEVDSYHAFEIDKYAIQIATKNYPDIVELGDITQWKQHKDNIPIPDLIIAGSPCQGFSNAGKGLNFDDPRSKLFFVFVDILNYYKARNPNLKFMLENVRMKKEWQDMISSYVGVEPVKLNSSLISAQNRVRLYWANFFISQPKDKEIVLRDILEGGEVDRDKSYCVDANYHKGGNPRSYFEDGKRQLVFIARLEEGRRLFDGNYFSRNFREGYRIYSSNGKAATLSAMPKGGAGGYSGLYEVGKATDIKGLDINLRVYSVSGKSPTLSTMQGGHREPKIAVDEIYYRKLTPLECERLQTLPDDYTKGVSNTQRYKMIGNGWTIDMVSHIFKCMII